MFPTLALPAVALVMMMMTAPAHPISTPSAFFQVIYFLQYQEGENHGEDRHRSGHDTGIARRSHVQTDGVRTLVEHEGEESRSSKFEDVFYWNMLFLGEERGEPEENADHPIHGSSPGRCRRCREAWHPCLREPSVPRMRRNRRGTGGR